MKKRPDLLDYGRTQYERDLLEFSVHINDLEVALQAGAGRGSEGRRARLVGLARGVGNERRMCGGRHRQAQAPCDALLPHATPPILAGCDQRLLCARRVNGAGPAAAAPV